MAPIKGKKKEGKKTKLPRSKTTSNTVNVVKVKKNSSKARNYDLGNGIYRFSRSKMFHKKAKYKFVGKKNPQKEKPKKPTTIEKPIGGEKNGGKRIVLLKKRKKCYPTAKRINRHPVKKRFSEHKRYIRRSLKCGTICILLAGRHKGKRVVLLKVLSSGLLLVTGPLRLNGCPLRRISQNYVIATKTRLNLSSLKIPEHLDDKYFKRMKRKRTKKEEGDIFAKKKESYVLSNNRETDQKNIDNVVMSAIKKRSDKTIIVRYLASMFGLKKTQYPHRLRF